MIFQDEFILILLGSILLICLMVLVLEYILYQILMNYREEKSKDKNYGDDTLLEEDEDDYEEDVQENDHIRIEDAEGNSEEENMVDN